MKVIRCRFGVFYFILSAVSLVFYQVKVVYKLNSDLKLDIRYRYYTTFCKVYQDILSAFGQHLNTYRLNQDMRYRKIPNKKFAGELFMCVS